VVDRVVEDVSEGFLILLFGLDLFGPEAPAEDVVLAGVAVVERPGVLAVQVAHSVREVRERCLEEQVVVVAEQAAGVHAPAVTSADAPQDLREDGAVPVVAEDRCVVIAFRPDVVVRAGGEVAAGSAHRGERSGGGTPETARSAFRHDLDTDVSRARQRTTPQPPRPNRIRVKEPP
jgi:hypothetical protein